MRILVLGDTHGDTRWLEPVVRALGGSVGMVIHLGDGAGDLERIASGGVRMPVALEVRGNADSDPSVPAFRSIRALDRTLLATHGHAVHGKGTLRPFVEAARASKADAYLFGHTHVPFKEESEGVLILNPGSLSRPRGPYGPSFAVIEVTREGMGPLEARFYEVSGVPGSPVFRCIHP